MVTGGYSKASGQRSKPYNLKYTTAPSHAERPRRSSSREKGKGWQRSKSSMYDYGSDLYFSEERTSNHHRHRRAHSSMSDRRTGKASYRYEIDCPAKQPRRRRASVEAVVKTAKPDSAVCQYTSPAGPPIEKRMLTVKPSAEKECLTPNKTFCGWTQTNKEKTYDQAKICDMQGPPARPYTPRSATKEPTPVEFPRLETKSETKSYECKQRLMERTFATESFRNRPASPLGSKNFEGPGNIVYPVQSFRPMDDTSEKSIIEKLRIELERSKARPGECIPGRIYIQMKEPATIEAIGIDINKTFVLTDPKGVVSISPRDGMSYGAELKLLPNRQKRLDLPGASQPQTSEPSRTDTLAKLPRDFALAETYPDKVKVLPGEYNFPFDLFVPEDLVPTFTYTSLNGVNVINNYSVEGVVKINSKTERTGRVPIEVPALGNEDESYKSEKRDYDFVVVNKYFTKDKGFDYAVGYKETEGGGKKKEKVTGQIIQRVKWRMHKLDDTNLLDKLDAVSMNSGKSNPVLDKYNQMPSSKPLSKEWDGNAYDENKLVTATMPSVSIGGFSCDYILQLTVDGKEYEGPIILVDEYSTKRVSRQDLSPFSKSEEFILRS